MNDNKLTDSIIEKIRNRDKDTLKHLVDNFYPEIRLYILKNSGTEEDAKDIFQEAFLIFFRKISNGDFILYTDFRLYMFSVCKNLWLHELRIRKTQKRYFERNRNMINLSEENISFDIEKDTIKEKIYQKYFNKLSNECKNILILHFQKKKADDIMFILNASNKKQIIDKIFRCKKKLFELILNSPEYKKYMTEK